MPQQPSKKRNPPWSRKELILALELYKREGFLDDHSLQVMQLSDILRELAFVQKEIPDVFRNPNGVAMKLANFAALDPAYTGRGLASYGKLDKKIWEEFANADCLLENEAAELRAGWQCNDLSGLVAEELAEDEYDPAGGVDLRERTTKAIVQRRARAADFS